MAFILATTFFTDLVRELATNADVCFGTAGENKVMTVVSCNDGKAGKLANAVCRLPLTHSLNV